MQTFLISEDFEVCAKCLDNKRLNKQKVEAYQILKTLHNWEHAKGWKNHPAVLMWKGHEEYLIKYALCIAKECLNRNFKDTLIPKIQEFSNYFKGSTYPEWLKNPAFFAAHRSNLLRKNAEYYGRFCWTEPHDLEYIWPIVKQ